MDTIVMTGTPFFCSVIHRRRQKKGLKSHQFAMYWQKKGGANDKEDSSTIERLDETKEGVCRVI